MPHAMQPFECGGMRAMKPKDRHKPGQGYTRYTPMDKPMGKTRAPRPTYDLKPAQRRAIAEAAKLWRYMTDGEVCQDHAIYMRRKSAYDQRMTQLLAMELHGRGLHYHGEGRYLYETARPVVTHTNTRPTYDPTF